MSEIKLPHNHGGDDLSLMDCMPSDETIETVVYTLKQLGDPSRLKIFWLLCHREECVKDIAAMTEMTSPAVSHHLRLLKSCGLITSRRSGKEMLYHAADTPIVNLLHQNIEMIADITCPNNDKEK